MSDSKIELDQLDQDSLPPQLEELNINSITTYCNLLTKELNSLLNANISLETGFLLKFFGNSSNRDNKALDFWRESSLMNSINPIWKINLSTRAFNYITSDSNKCENMQYLISLIIGRFSITEKSEYYYLVKPRYLDNEKLFAIIIVQKNPEKESRILVGLDESDSLEQVIKLTIDEFCNKSRKIASLSEFEHQKLFIENEERILQGDISFFEKQNSRCEIEEKMNLNKIVQGEGEKLIECTKKVKDNGIKINESIVSGEIENADEIIIESDTITFSEEPTQDQKNIETKDKIIDNKNEKNIDSRNVSINKVSEVEIKSKNTEVNDDKIKTSIEIINKKEIDIQCINEEYQIEKYNKQNEKPEAREVTKEIDKSELLENDEKNIRNGNFIAKSSIGPFFKNENEKRHYIDINQPFTQLKEFEEDLPLDLLKLKQSIKKNRENYLKALKLTENDLESWIDFIIYYLTLQQSKTPPFDIFCEFNILWKIEIDKKLLNIFKDIKELEFLHYFNKILQFSQGYAIDNFEDFIEIYKNSNENFLALPIIMENTNLKPLLSVFCLNFSSITREYQWLLKIKKFNTTKSLETQISDIRNIEEGTDLKTILLNPGIKALILIEKNKKMIPVSPIKPLKNRDLKTILFLYPLPKDPTSSIFYLLNKENNKIISENDNRKLIDKNSQVYLVNLQINSKTNSNYSLQMKLKNTWKGDSIIPDNINRIVKNLEYQFLFNVYFDKDNFNRSYHNKNHFNIYYGYFNKNSNFTDNYQQLLLYLKNIQDEKPEMFECLIQSFENLEKEWYQKTSLESQKLIIHYIDSNYLSVANENNIEFIYRSLCLFGILENFHFKPEIFILSNIGKVISFIQMHSENYIRDFKIRPNFNSAMNGLAKILALARLNSIEIIHLFHSIYDYDILSQTFSDYFKILKNNKISINPEELNYFLRFLNNFGLNQKKVVLDQILDTITELEQKIEILMHPVFDFRPISEKKELLSYAFRSIYLNNQALLNLLQYLKANDIYGKGLVETSYILKFIEYNLSWRRVDYSEFIIVEPILDIIRAEPRFKNFDLKSCIQNQVFNHGFHECINLFLNSPNYIPDLLQAWAQNKNINPRSDSWIIAIDKQLQFLPEDIQKVVSLKILDQLSDFNLKVQLTNICNARCEILKSNYKELFSEKLLKANQEVLKETLRFMESEKNKKSGENYILNSLFSEAISFLNISYEDLIQRIAKSPKRDYLLNIMKKNEKTYNINLFQCAFDFVKKLAVDICNKELNMEIFELILQHKSELRKIFMEYMECGFDKPEDFETFTQLFSDIEKEIKANTDIFKQIAQLSYGFSHDFPAFFDFNQNVVAFIRNTYTLKMSEFTLTENILILNDLLKFPLRSRLFKIWIHKSAEKFKENYQECFTSVNEALKNFIGGFDELNISELEEAFEFIDPSFLVDNEIRILKEIYSEAFTKDSLFKSIANMFKDYKDHKILLKYLEISSKPLELPKSLFEKYIFQDNQKYSSHFLSSFTNLKLIDLSSFTKQDLNSLISFFSQISESSQLVVLAYSLEEDEINFWRESFDESLDNKEISLKLIQKFSIIWSFFDILKNSKKNLKCYFDKVLDLIKTNKYLTIIESICECNLKFNVLDEFNKSLNNQEQVKMNKIKMICQDSSFRVMGKGNYTVELIAAKPNEGYTSAPISLNDLNELRDRALLSKYIIDQRNEKSEEDRTNDLQTFDQFVSFVEKLYKYIFVLNELGYSLYRDSLPDEFNYKLNQGNFEKLNKDFEKYEKFLNLDWKIGFKAISKKSYHFNFLSEEMINLIDRFVFNSNQENLEKITRVLKYMGKQASILKERSLVPPSDINQRLSEINDFMLSLKDSQDQIENPLQVSTKPYPVGSIIIAETKEFYQGILSIYTLYQKFLPRADLVLFCHSSTSWIELNRFIKRCSLNPKHEIYTLVHPEELRLENQLKIDSKLNRMALRLKSISLAIVTKDCKSKLVSSLSYNSLFEKEKIQNLMMLSDEQILNIMKNLSQNIVVVTSAYTGLGKTDLIETVAKNKKIPLCEINISATYDSCGLTNRIKSALKQGPTLYKFNLNYLLDHEYFHELIFSMTVFKVVYNEQSIIAIPEDSFIYIEVANTFKNKLYLSVPFLKFLKTEDIKVFNIEKVAITDKLIYVCSYLSKLSDKKINEIDLKFDVDSKKSLFSDKNHYFELLRQYFLPNCGESPNFHQLTTFLKVLTKLFQKFEISIFGAGSIKYISESMNGEIKAFYKEIRSCIILSLIETSKEFISKCIDNVKNSQDSMLKSLEDEKQVEICLIDSTIKWENSNHYIMIFFDEDYINIYRSPDQVPSFIKKFITSQNLIIAKKITAAEVLEKEFKKCEDTNEYLENYSNLKSEELIKKLVECYKMFSLKTEAGNNEIYKDRLKKRISEAINTGYVLTPDNFLKMNLIFLRSMSELPSIIMGETGCGKTSLLRFFIEVVLKESFQIIYIHSGITISDIQRDLERANEEAINNPINRIWVLFDEFNTSDCMGEIVSVLCERKFEGIIFQPNIVFIGACNPYRLKFGQKFEENVGIKKTLANNTKVQVMHVVKPLPDKAIEYVWDFGTLKHNEIRDYVYSMLDKVNVKQIKLFTNMICAAHEYFQNIEDSSSVSLRDVNRFILLYKWFSQSIEDRKRFNIEKASEDYVKSSEIIKTLNNFSEIFPEILSFIHCYYLRLSSEEQRKTFIDLMVLQFSQNEIKLNRDQVQILIQYQELDLVNRMNLPKEIALNQALIENIFAIVPCVLNKIPIFICGKPGCSKSLAINIISSSLRGDRSTDDYFKTLPELQIVSFQGSDSCTSEGIEEVFNRAGKLLNQNKNILPVVLFDEIGLAEISRYNPLKVLHKLLEYENCNVGFIAISNWRLDASKMNRALYLARPDPDEKDLILTAKTLFSSYRKIDDFEKYLSIISDIAKGYFKMKQEYRKTDYPDFFGLRDFYHTIKYIARNFSASINNDLNSIIQTALYRNFDGLSCSIKKLPEYFPAVFNEHVLVKDPVKLIESNLKDPESRYLMIICAQDVSEYLKSEVLSKYLDEHRFILGSTFEKDTSQEDSRFKKLSDIISYMEQGVPIILQNMEIIYSSLYDLFNQNFTILGKTRKYCRVALGAQFNPRCLIHENFKAVVFLDNQELTLLTTDAPFLNRFEKHYILLNDIIQKNSIKLSQEICKWVDLIFKIPNKKNYLSACSVFPIFSQETINLLIVFLGENMDNNQLVEKCKKFLLQNASSDIILLCQLNEISQKDRDFIVETWNKLHSSTILTYLRKLADKNRYEEKQKRVKIISVTYDSAGIDFIKQELDQVVQLEKCSNFKCEDELRKNYGSFLRDNGKILYVLELDYSKESHHLRFITSLINSLDKNFEVKEKKLVKNVCIIIRQKRSDEERKPIFLFKDWRYKMFEDLINNSKEITQELMQKNLSVIAKEGKFFKLKNYYGDIVEKALETLLLDASMFDYQYLNSFKKEISEIIISDPRIIICFKEKIIDSLLQLDKISTEKWILQLFTSEKVINSAISVKDAVKVILYDKFLFEFTKLIVACEKKYGLSSLSSIKSSDILFDIWRDVFLRIQTTQIRVQIKPEANKLNFVTKFRTPFFYEDYKLLKNKYTELFDLGFIGKESSIILKNFYSEKSILKEKSNTLYENKDFEMNFVRDFIEISIIEKSCDLKYLEYIYFFIWSLLSHTENESKIFKLFEYQSKIVLFNKLILVYNKYSNDLSSILQNLMQNIPLNEIHMSLFRKIIHDVSPLGYNFNSIEDINTYSEDLLSLNSIILGLTENQECFNFDLFEFWVQLCAMNNKELVTDIATKIMNKPNDYLFKTEIATWALQHFKMVCNNDEAMYRFYMFFFNKIVQNNSEMVPFIISQITDLNLWIYSAELVETILNCCNIKEIIKNFEAGLISFEDILKNQNSYLEKISEIVKSLDSNSPFSVMLSSKLESLKFCTPCNNYGEICKIYMDYIENSNNSHSIIKLIIAVNRIQFYLKQFCEFLTLDKEKLKESEVELINAIGITLGKRNLLTYELFCLKVLKRFTGDTLQLNEFCSKTDYKWKINYYDIRVNSDLDLFPVSEHIANSNRYTNLVIKIKQLNENLNRLDEELNQTQTANNIQELGLAFLNTVYLMHTKKNFDKSIYIKWYEQKSNIIANQFGKPFSLLLKNFIYNYSNENLCYLHENIEKKELYISMLINYITLNCISHCKVQNRFSSQFFMLNGEAFENFSQKSEEIFYIGAETHRMQDFLKCRRENFDLEKNAKFSSSYSKGGSYVCSNTCDYFYIILDCGGAASISDCPFCKCKIGGSGHKPVQREGHRNLTDAEAIIYLDEKNKYYQGNENKGFQLFNNNMPSTIHRKLKNINTFTILNFFTNSVFYILHTLNIYPVDQLKAVYKINEEDLKETIQIIIKQNYKQFEVFLGNEDLIYWLLGSVNKFSDVMDELPGESKLKEERDEFEEVFENKISSKSFLEISNEFKKCLNTQTKPSQLIMYIEEFAKPQESNYAYTDLFRFRVKPSWSLMKHKFMMMNNKEEFMILNYYIQNFEEIQNLEHFWPILTFSKEMISDCSFQVSRAEAKQKSIRELLKEKEHLSQPFKEFIKAWKNLKPELRFGCKTFQKMEITYETPIGYFLLETDLNSQGIQIAAAIKTLCEIQNSVCTLLPSNNKEGIQKYSISTLSKEDIFYINHETLESMVQKSSINLFEDSKGEEIFYDFPQLLINFKKYIEKAKIINSENLEVMQYQFELLHARSKYAGIISDIRNNFEQLPLNPEEIRTIERTVQVKSKEHKVDIVEIWNQAYIWLEKVILNLRHHKSKEILNLQIYSNIHLNTLIDFKVPDIFFPLKVNQFLAIYELVEIQVFPKVVKTIDQQYKIEIDDKPGAIEMINKFYEQVCLEISKDTFFECFRVLRRVIVRLLTANTDPEFMISDYFGLESFWNNAFLDVAEKAGELFPADFRLRNAVEVDKLMESKVKELLV